MLAMILFLFAMSSSTDPGNVDESCAFLPAGSPCPAPPPPPPPPYCAVQYCDDAPL